MAQSRTCVVTLAPARGWSVKVALLVLFLAGDTSCRITDSVVSMDGGYTSW